MTTLTEKMKGAHFLTSEANGSQSRDNVVIASGAGVVLAGTVLGKLTSGGKYVPSPDTGADGSQTGVAVLLETVDATSADAAGAVISRNAEVNANQLIYPASVSDNTKKGAKNTQLAAVGIIARS